jgi:cytochrome c oxidase cbb3-type subunit 1
VANIWFAPIALATIYYFLPKILGRPIYGYYLAPIGFWSLIMFSGWLGTRALIFGPIPVWIQTVGIVGSMAMLVPTVAIAINLLGTVRGRAGEVWGNPVLRFLVFSALAFISGVVINAAASLRVVHQVTGFTDFTVAQNQQGFYAFFVMAMFGAAYYMLPRIFARDWPAVLLMKANFWCCAAGIVLLLAVLYIGGWQQGAAMNDPFTPFVDILRAAIPVNQARAAAEMLLALGQLAFVINAGGLMLWWAKDNCPVCRVLQTSCPVCKVLKGRAS